jgi:hypothetical protein
VSADDRHPVLPRFRFPDGELGSWAVLGDLTDRSVRLWLREPGGSAEAALSIGGEVVSRVVVETDPGHDHVGVAVLEADRPRPAAEFEVRVGEMVRRGRFAQAAGTPARFAFAFGSCHQPFAEEDDGAGQLRPQPAAGIYPHIQALLAERAADFALWLGDQIYSDAVADMEVRERLAGDASVTDEALLETYRHLHRGFFNQSGFRALAEAVPAYLMWDDHDIFDGYGSLLDKTAIDDRLFAAADTAFREYQHLRNPTGALAASRPYGFSFWRGDVGLHVPDLRSERDFHRQRVLAGEGWARLDTFLEEATERDVPTVFVGLSVPLVHASPLLMRLLEGLRTTHGRDVRDRWSVPHFAADRTRLLERLFEWQSARPRRQVIVLSGDVHVGAAFNVRPRSGSGRFTQWTSSALSTPTHFGHVLANRLVTKVVRLGERELRVWRRGLATTNNVGLVEVAPADGGGHVVRLSIHGYDPRADALRLAYADTALPA